MPAKQSRSLRRSPWPWALLTAAFLAGCVCRPVVYGDVRFHPPPCQRNVAIHEAAHAVARVAFFGAGTITEAHIHILTRADGTSDHLGIVLNDGTKQVTHPRYARMRIVEFLIGEIAEDEIGSGVPDGGGTDADAAEDLAWALYTHQDWRKGQKAHQRKSAPPQIRAKVQAELDRGATCAERMVEENEEVILLLADQLMKVRPQGDTRVLTGKQIAFLLAGKTIKVPCTFD